MKAINKTGDTTQFGVIIILFLTFGTAMLDRMASLHLGPYLVKELNLSASQIGLLASALRDEQEFLN